MKTSYTKILMNCSDKRFKQGIKQNTQNTSSSSTKLLIISPIFLREYHLLSIAT